MKSLVLVLALALPTVVNAQVSYEYLNSVKVTNNDCSRIDWWVDWAETQLRLRGIYGREPESLNNTDRLYNLRARSIIWSLRIGCANPNRYSK
jgi:uncharacterized protein YutD